MKYLYIFLAIIAPKLVEAPDISCRFDEVYSNGQTHEGHILYTKNKIRYQYLRDDLFSIFYSKLWKWKVLKNDTKQEINISQKNLELMMKVKDIFDDFPNIEKIYSFDSSQIELELNSTNTFLRSIIIRSQSANLRIHFYDCSFEPINHVYLSFDPYFKYPKQ